MPVFDPDANRVIELQMKMDMLLDISGMDITGDENPLRHYLLSGFASVEEANVAWLEKKKRQLEGKLHLYNKVREINREIVELTRGSVDHSADIDELERISREYSERAP